MWLIRFNGLAYIQIIEFWSTEERGDKSTTSQCDSENPVTFTSKLFEESYYISTQQTTFFKLVLIRKRIYSSIMLASLLFMGVIQTGCFGSFALTKKVYEFNDGLENKWLKSIAFWGLNIILVYGFAGFVDVVILNLVEFWTGSNPLAMQEGEVEEQIIAFRGESY